MAPIQQMLLGLGAGGDGQWQTYIDTGFLGNAGDTTFGDYRLNNLHDVRIILVLILNILLNISYPVVIQ